MSKQSAQSQAWPTTGPIVSLPAAFEDERGAIQTLVDGGVQSVQIITSKANSVRANHYHKTDAHYMYVLKGAMKYIHRPADDTSAPSWLLVKEGQLIYTPPLVEHAVEFLEDSVLLNITAKPRDQSSYEDDLVRVSLHKPAGQAGAG
jgi:quercetin dioxygenase-like cupin family protein